MDELIKRCTEKSEEIKRGGSLLFIFMPIVLISEPFQSQQRQIHSLYYQLSCPARSIACSIVSVVNTPKITGMSVCSDKDATPFATSLQT